METATLPLRNCWICGRAISLEMCKIDEHGLPVHGACLNAVGVFRLKMQRPKASKTEGSLQPRQ